MNNKTNNGYLTITMTNLFGGQEGEPFHGGQEGEPFHGGQEGEEFKKTRRVL